MTLSHYLHLQMLGVYKAHVSSLRRRSLIVTYHHQEVLLQVKSSGGEDTRASLKIPFGREFLIKAELDLNGCWPGTVAVLKQLRKVHRVGGGSGILLPIASSSSPLPFFFLLFSLEPPQRLDCSDSCFFF